MKRTTTLLSSLFTATALLIAGNAMAATASQNITLGATVANLAKLSFNGTTAISFPNADPDTTATIVSTDVPAVDAMARTGNASPVTLTVRASSDLTSGTDTIPVSNVSWAASGSGFSGGVMSTASDVAAGNWSGSGKRSGTFTYSLTNGWYTVGTYTTTVAYTLTSP